MDRIEQRIEEASHIVVIAHVNPDADSLGAASAIYTYLLQRHKKVSFYCASKHRDQKFVCIPWFEKIRDSFPVSADLAIVLDCASKERLGVDLKCDIINIDHRISNTFYGDLNLVESKALSTTQVLYNWFCKNDVKINAKMATALYAGLLDDSEGFISEDVDGTTFALVSELFALGAESQKCNAFLRRYESLASLRIKGWMLQNIELFNDATIATIIVSRDMIETFGAQNSDLTHALEEALYLPTVKVAFLLRENRDGSIKCSMRSLDPINLSEFAQSYNGGGHQRRAGFILQGDISLAHAKEEILQKIRKDLGFETK